jgi:CBS domain-containing protein
MTPNPKSIDQGATVRETAEILQKHGIHVAPVIDAAGRPIGVVSRTDLLDYWGRRRDRLTAIAAGDLDVVASPTSAGRPGDELTVGEIMTPVVFGVRISAPIASVIEKILALGIRSLFVTDEHGVLVGTISVFDVLRYVVQHGADQTGLETTNRRADSGTRSRHRRLATAMPP